MEWHGTSHLIQSKAILLWNCHLPCCVYFGGSNPPAVIQLNCKILDWCSKVKYLGLYLISGINFRIDLNAAKQKYYGCFNNIKSVIRKHIDEIMLLKLIKTYWLPRLLYGCEIWPTETLDMHELDIIWNNCFRHFFLYFCSISLYGPFMCSCIMRVGLLYIDIVYCTTVLHCNLYVAASWRNKWWMMNEYGQEL